MARAAMSTLPLLVRRLVGVVVVESRFAVLVVAGLEIGVGGFGVIVSGWEGRGEALD